MLLLFVVLLENHVLRPLLLHFILECFHLIRQLLILLVLLVIELLHFNQLAFQLGEARQLSVQQFYLKVLLEGCVLEGLDLLALRLAFMDQVIHLLFVVVRNRILSVELSLVLLMEGTDLIVNFLLRQEIEVLSLRLDVELVLFFQVVEQRIKAFVLNEQL